ncbi:phage tail tip lysozyme [Ruminococcus sp.]|uniref:phage tail tip lysozyme n=1 Tax=Ruminococcus sp. TaxID=41978 RepID=UPI0025F2A8A1|nr:phage tail tip lysozyme [Ruminococcus sp.]MBQ6252736.1 hypothetical protein [Ruminococcus sp.]
MKKVNLRRTITGFAAAAAMAFTAIAPTAINVSPIAPTAISASAATINMTQDEFNKGQHIYSYLKSHTNWNDGAICGILTHLYTESRYQPTVVNKSSGAYGVAQWLGQRRTYLKQRRNYESIDVQLQFLIDEINNNDPCASDDFKISRNAILSASNSATGAGNTVYTFRMNYGWGVSVPSNASYSVIADCSERRSEAAFFYNKFAGGNNGGGGSNTELPYTVNLTSGTPIYKTPGSTATNGQITVTTLYTIVEEQTANNIKYGKLKSGAGWVKLGSSGSGSGSGSGTVNTDEIAVNYPKQLAKGTAIYKDAGSSVVNQYLSAAGTFTIVGEKTVNSVKYGRLKSGAGWVKL